MKRVTAIANELAKLENDIANLSKKLDDINAKYKATWEKGIQANNAYNDAKAKCNAIIAENKPQFDKLVGERDALVKEIDPSLLTRYNNFKSGKNNRMPFIVPYDRSTTSCPRCFMTIENATLAQLNAPGDSAECPNCRRILFIPEQ